MMELRRRQACSAFFIELPDGICRQCGSMLLIVGMYKKVYFPQPSFYPAGDAIGPGVDAGMIRSVPAVGYKANKGKGRRQSHVDHIPSAGSVGDDSADPQLPKKVPCILSGSGSKPGLLP